MVLLRATTPQGSCSEGPKQGAAGALGNVATLQTLVLLVYFESGCFASDFPNEIRMRGQAFKHANNRNPNLMQSNLLQSWDVIRNSVGKA